jgi:hypothetical protein
MPPEIAIIDRSFGKQVASVCLRLRHHRGVSVAVMVALAASLAVVTASPSLAYRPFNGTDAAATDPGELRTSMEFSARCICCE